jgi:hypothetical protein
MRVDGQRHAPAVGKETRYPLYRRPVWTGAEYLALTGIRSPDRPARSESLYRLQCRLRRVLHFAWWCRPDQQTLRAWTDCVRCMFKCLGVSLHAPITSINQSRCMSHTGFTPHAAKDARQPERPAAIFPPSRRRDFVYKFSSPYKIHSTAHCAGRTRGSYSHRKCYRHSRLSTVLNLQVGNFNLSLSPILITLLRRP